MMKKYTFAIFAGLIMAATAVNAQDKKDKASNSVEVRVEKMSTDLGLNETEKASVKSLLEKQATEKKQFTKENDKESAEFKSKMKELQKKQSGELKAVIGDEKFKKMQALKAEEKKEN